MMFLSSYYSKKNCKNAQTGQTKTIAVKKNIQHDYQYCITSSRSTSLSQEECDWLSLPFKPLQFDHRMLIHVNSV